MNIKNKCNHCWRNTEDENALTLKSKTKGKEIRLCVDRCFDKIAPNLINGHGYEILEPEKE